MERESKDFFRILEIIGKTKTTKRTGWVRDGVKNAESVCDHIYRTSVLAVLLAKKLGYSETKILKMALVHDLSEGLTGDKVFERGTAVNKELKAKKAKAEMDAIKEIFSDKEKEYYNLYQEYDEQSTPEARFLKQVEKLEMAMQAYEYEKQTGLTLQEYFDNAKMHLKEPELIEIFNKILEARKQLRKNNKQTINYRK